MSNPTTITAEPGLPFIDVVRDFDAPPAAVFRAHVDPKLFAEWTGPRDMKMDSVELNPVEGGRWHYTFRGDGDAPFTFSGVFHAVHPDRLIVQTFEFSMAPGAVGIGTTRLDEINGRTRLSNHEVYPSVEARDMALASGMEYGIKEGYERLDELLAGVRDAQPQA
jgi:uncharacterized protein YndB with AHSA1/START domain